MLTYEEINHEWNNICKFYEDKAYHNTPIKNYLKSLVQVDDFAAKVLGYRTGITRLTVADLANVDQFACIAFAVALEMNGKGGVSLRNAGK